MLLVGLIGYATWWMRESNAAIEEASQAVEISNAYRDALQAISEGQVIVADFQQRPDVTQRLEFGVIVLRAANALNFISENGSDEDKALIAGLYRDYASRVGEVGGLMDEAILAGSTSQEFPPEKLVDEVRLLLTVPEETRRAEAANKLADYRAAQKQQTAIVVGGLTLGLPILAGLLVLIRIYERREVVSNLTLERLELAALTDSLTGLGNHRAYQEELHAKADMALGGSAHLSLAVIDVDEFKEINDSAGHARGDQILFQLGRLLREATHARDLRFRVGGDEFAVILPGSNQVQATEIMERFRVLASLTGASVSIGVAQLEPGDDTEILREKADSALYTAKRRGRNTICTFSGDNAEQMVVTQSKIKALRELVRGERIDIAYQPVLSTDGNTIMGYEALARIPAGYDLSGPQEAFDIAERIGRAHDLDFICIREGLRRARNLLPGHILFLNISPRSLDHAGFSAPLLAEMVMDAGLVPEQICFEITERSTAPIDIVEQEAAALRTLGFRLALDDVGAGNSGLEMMRRLKVDYVKIDRSVLLGALDRGAGRAVMLAIIVFASEAGAIVIAEGIETPEMLAVIQETNDGPFAVQGIQGFILGAPASSLDSEPEPLKLSA